MNEQLIYQNITDLPVQAKAENDFFWGITVLDFSNSPFLWMRCFQNTIKCVLPTAAASGWHSLLHCQMHNQWGLCEYVIAHTNLPPSPVILRIEMVAKPAKTGSVTIFSDFLRSFARAKKWLLLAQVSWTSARSAARTASPPKLS